MAESEAPKDLQGVTFEWMQITQAVAQGRLAPDEGVARLKVLADANPADRGWLQDEIETIQQQFGLNVAEIVRDDQSSYWEKLRSVIDALLDERLDHDRALDLLKLIDAAHPEHSEHTTRLVSGIADSPLRRFLGTGD